MSNVYDLLPKEQRDALKGLTPGVAVPISDRESHDHSIEMSMLRHPSNQPRLEDMQRAEIQQVLIQYAHKSIHPADLARTIDTAVHNASIEHRKAAAKAAARRKRLQADLDDEHSHGGTPSLYDGC